MTMETQKMLDFKDKVAIVTGAGSGMGTGIAKTFAKAGANVAITYNSNEDAAKKIVSELEEFGVKASAFKLDQRKPQECARIAEKIYEEFGKIDILVNNAGLNINMDSLELTEEIWDKIMDTNTKGFFFMSREVAKQMIKANNGGAIVSIASINGITPLADAAHYGASKAGVIMGTRSLARDFGKYGIRVNAVAPGLMDAPQLDINVPGWRESFEERSALGRIGQYEDIGNVCLFLASPMSSWVTGETIIADGGVILAEAY